MKTTILAIALLLSQMNLKAQRVYMISALGCDSSIYCNLKLDSSLQVNYVKWLKPCKKESLESYCDRLITANNITSEDIIIGTSFGGIVATVISLKVNPRLTILISSISRMDEKPEKFRFLQIFRCHKVIPKSLMNKPGLIIHKCFGKVSDEEMAFLSDMVKRNDVDLISWSVDQIMRFDNMTEPSNLYKINGLHDKVFHVNHVDADFLLDGTHLMVFNKADEVSDPINSLILDHGNLATRP